MMIMRITVVALKIVIAQRVRRRVCCCRFLTSQDCLLVYRLFSHVMCPTIKFIAWICMGVRTSVRIRETLTVMLLCCSCLRIRKSNMGSSQSNAMHD